MSTDEQLAQKQRVLNGGVIPKLVTICKESNEVDSLCESIDFITLLGTSPTSLEEEHIIEFFPVLVDLAGYGSHISALLQSIDLMPHCQL